ncbi:MAG: C40 family peptidase [Deltaproteobacteria bacterium]|jgi:LysM repeat protein|nr:C40 family peptidase [Deltaproteobacteria bacterium]
MVPDKNVPALAGLNQNKVHGILKTAFSQMGNPYRYGGNSPETGFDCSGFVTWVYKQYGVSLPRSSRDMLAVGVPVERGELRPGDLVFFNYGYSHVGIYTGDNNYIHSPRTGKRIEEASLNGKGRGDHFVGGRRIINNNGVGDVSARLKDEWIKDSRHRTDMALNDAAGKRHSATRSSRATTTAAARTASNKPAAAGGSVRHKVASGDNLVTLARRYGTTSAEIARANNLKNKNQIKPGQTLVIPTKAQGATQTAANKKKPSSSSSAKPKPKPKPKG